MISTFLVLKICIAYVLPWPWSKCAWLLYITAPNRTSSSSKSDFSKPEYNLKDVIKQFNVDLNCAWGPYYCPNHLLVFLVPMDSGLQPVEHHGAIKKFNLILLIYLSVQIYWSGTWIKISPLLFRTRRSWLILNGSQSMISPLRLV